MFWKVLHYEDVRIRQNCYTDLASVVQPVDDAIHWVNLYPEYSAIGFPNIHLAPVVQTLDSAIHRINHYPMDKYYGNQLCYPLDSDLSGG